jgi:type I restriction enzyme, S subunit
MTTTRRLGDICEVRWGDTSKTKASYVPDGYPAFSASGCDGFMPHFDHEGPGIVLSAIGAQCGKTWFTDGRWSCIKNTIYIKVHAPDVDPRFVFYATSDPVIWPKRGAAQPFISQTDAQNVAILTPPLAAQRRVAGLLSAYDDLIENCERRIRVLDEMARALYREWFVLFRYPGHEKTPSVASTLRTIPRGWRVRRVDELAAIKGGKQLAKEHIASAGRYPVFGGNGIQGYAEQATAEGFVIAFGRVGAYCGSIHWSYDGAWLNNNSSGVLPLAHDELILHHLQHYDFTQLRGGSAQPFISNSALAQVELLVPNESLAHEFCMITQAWGRLQATLQRKLTVLRRTRDLLLPRLLSGQLTLEAPA